MLEWKHDPGTCCWELWDDSTRCGWITDESIAAVDLRYWEGAWVPKFPLPAAYPPDFLWHSPKTPIGPPMPEKEWVPGFQDYILSRFGKKLPEEAKPVTRTNE
jgi:hypothetical protein